jgi:hypothetical protein
LALYDKLSSNREFAKDCRSFDRLDAHTDLGDQRTAEAAVQFYLKWSVYPLPEFLMSNHNFRVWLEQIFVRKGRVFHIPVSPLTTKAEVLHDFREIEKLIRRPRKVPDLKRLRIALMQNYLLVRSHFHGFKPSDFAAAMGSKARKGKPQNAMSSKELKQADRRLSDLLKQGIPYPKADSKATRQIVKKRWREAKLTPKIRMASQRAMRVLETLLLSDPNK